MLTFAKCLDASGKIHAFSMYFIVRSHMLPSSKGRSRSPAAVLSEMILNVTHQGTASSYGESRTPCFIIHHNVLLLGSNSILGNNLGPMLVGVALTPNTSVRWTHVCCFKDRWWPWTGDPVTSLGRCAS